jgi:hypothetical protein
MDFMRYQMKPFIVKLFNKINILIKIISFYMQITQF